MSDIRLDDYAAAIDLLATAQDQAGTLGSQWLQHAMQHLTYAADRYLRDTLRPGTEREAVALLKTQAAKLRQSGQALLQAAEQLKSAGRAKAASDAHLAYQAAEGAAQEWLRA